MEILIIVVIGALAIAGASQLGARLGLAPALLLLALGIVVGYLPVVPAIEVNPEVVLLGVLPPLLFSTAVSMPTMNFRREFMAVAVLAVLLVALSALVVGVVLSWAIPGVSLAWGIAMGAVLSPTDAVAISIARRLGVSQRIITVLEGEGLLNDATALVILTSAVAAATAGSVTLGGVVGGFASSVLIALLVGWLVGEVSLRLRSCTLDPTVDTVISFTVPFIAALPAEHFGGSGLVAAVVAGLVTGFREPRLLPPGHRLAGRQNWHTVELVLEGFIFLVMGLQFFGIVERVSASGPSLGPAISVALMAGTLTIVVRAAVVSPMLKLLGASTARRSQQWEEMNERMSAFKERCDAIANGEVGPARRVPWDRRRRERSTRTALLTALTAVRRLVPGRRDAAPAGEAERREQHTQRAQRRVRRTGADLDYFTAQPLGPREGAVIVWAGMRGAVTLAAAQTLPATAPHRPFLLLVAILVAAGSLVIQGLTLPALVRLVQPAMAGRADDAERASLTRLLVAAAKDVAMESRPEGAYRPESDEVAPHGELSMREAFIRAWARGERPSDAVGADGPQEADGLPPSLEEAVLQAKEALARAEVTQRALDTIRAQRDALLDARDDGLYCAQTLEYALARLDYEEIMLTSRPA